MGQRLAPAPAVELPVRLKRRHRAQALSGALQDGPAALTLLTAGVAGLRAPRGTTDLVLALVELAVAGVVLHFLVRAVAEGFGSGEGPAHGGGGGDTAEVSTAAGRIRWEGVAVGLLALVEVWHHWHATGRVKRPTLLAAVTALALALGGKAALERRFRSRRARFEVSGDGVYYRASRWRRFAARWDEVARAEGDERALRLVLRDGRTWALAADDHLDGRALVRAARAAVGAHAPPRLAGGMADAYGGRLTTSA